MIKIAKRIIARIQGDTIGTDINLSPRRLKRWERFIDKELAAERKREDAEEVKKQFGSSSRKELAKEARRQSRMLRDDPQEQEILEAWEKIADRTGWK
jgi:hypothetical protein